MTPEQTEALEKLGAAMGAKLNNPSPMLLAQILILAANTSLRIDDAIDAVCEQFPEAFELANNLTKPKQ